LKNQRDFDCGISGLGGYRMFSGKMEKKLSNGT
jgi:hypothetical protein